MALPEGYLPRKGDMLTLRGCVTHDFDLGDDYIHIRLDGAYSGVVIKPETIVSLAWRAWQIGEKVMPINRSCPYEEPALVLNIHDEYVWIDDPFTGPSTYHANSIEPWVPAKSALVDEAAMQELTAVQEAMKEPPPAPLPPGSSAQVDDDENIF